MPAKLDWDKGTLKLGQLALAETAGQDARPRYRVAGAREWSKRYELLSDAEQDCETEVRRLLREAGVVVQ